MSIRESKAIQQEMAERAKQGLSISNMALTIKYDDFSLKNVPSTPSTMRQLTLRHYFLLHNLTFPFIETALGYAIPDTDSDASPAYYQVPTAAALRAEKPYDPTSSTSNP